MRTLLLISLFCLLHPMLSTPLLETNAPPLSSPARAVKTISIAERVLDKGLATIDMGLYPGSLLMHGMSELAVEKKDPQLLQRTLDLFADFKSKKIEGRGSFISYAAGGSGAAYLDYLQKTDQLSEQVLQHADQMFREQKRSSEGIITANWAKDSLDQVFIDIAFAVTPYLLYAGLKYQKPEYVDVAVFETLELFKLLKDHNGLLHQARGFNGLDVISEDNWSRGNGWGAFALATLVRDLPDSHPQKAAVNLLAKNFFSTILKFQNEEGLWHQEMSDPTSYVETSGSGLMLYGLGIAIEKKILAKSTLSNFKKGLSGYLSYIAEDGSVSHTCRGCLSPGKGTKQDYKDRRWIYNDPHAFGPVVLAFNQAAKLGIKRIKPLTSLGLYADNPDLPGKPKAYIRHLPDANGNIAWENDRMAFRIYGPPVKDRVSSGIDVWAKSVDHPIIDKWHYLNAAGESYHLDRGEGCDFFQVGFSRGVGGTAIWYNQKPYISQTYASYEILKNSEEEIAFEVHFDPWQIDGFTVAEKKIISMKKGDNFFKVVSTFTTDSKKNLTAAIGIAYARDPEITTDAQKGLLSVWEAYPPKNGELGTTVLVNPNEIESFQAFQKEHFVLLPAKAGKPITYYVGAGWSKSPQFNTEQDWADYIHEVAQKLTF